MKIFRSFFLLFAVSLLSCKKEQDNKVYLRPSGLGLPQTKIKSKPKTMAAFTIKPFLAIDGIGAASGIVYIQDNLYIVGDNSGFLYKYNLVEHKLDKFALIANASDTIAKKSKPDFESITIKKNKLYLFGSGSTKKRNKRYSFDIITNEIKFKNQKKTHQLFKEISNINDENFNIEGTFFYKNKQYSFQRGNGSGATNGIFEYDKISKKTTFVSIELPVIMNIHTSFTDAILVENKIYFLATAENTSDTYNDGEILGSIFGSMDLETKKIDFTHQISSSQKYEGITLYKNTATEFHFLLCEDNDTEVLESKIFELILKK